MNDDDVRALADAIWEYILNKHLKDYLSGNISFYRAVVTTAASGGVMGVTRPYDSEIFLPYSWGADSLAVGSECIVFVFGDESNARVVGDGTLSSNGSGGGGGGGDSYTLPAATSSTLGGVKVPSANGLSVANNGTLSVAAAGASTRGTVILDSAPASGSANAVSSGGVYTAIENAVGVAIGGSY